MSDDSHIGLIDCDIHQVLPDEKALFSYLPKRYVEYINDFGDMMPTMSYTGIPGRGARHDLWAEAPGGVNPAASPQIAIEKHLNVYGVDLAILTGGPYSAGVHPDPDYAMAYCRAYNDWTADTWLSADPRFRGSIHIAPTDPLLAVQEIERLASDKRFIQVLMAGGARLPFGNRHYHPIYAACERHGLPMACHFGGEGTGMSGPPTAAGYPTYYLEMRMARSQMGMAHLVSLICEGVFEKFPGLKYLSLEQGIFWVPGLLWQMDADWKALRDYTPWVKRLPSEYVRTHVRFGSQPMVEPPSRRDLETFLEWIHAEDILVFSSDYPHFDWDEPSSFLKGFDPSLREKIFSGNARKLYGLET
jgi:uncharacterized protein